MKIDDFLNYKIGIIGLGVLGSAIAECFINKKIRIIGYDKSDKFYKKLNKSYFSSASSIDKLYSDCDIVLTCLPSEQSLIDVTKNLKSEVLIIETST
jgi:3-hydroxyisobutyrate dehydrogenase-like beta-hydroxyacid dehydrogenase